MGDWLHGVRVPPMNILKLRGFAEAIRQDSMLEADEPFPVLRFLEWSMGEIVGHFDWEIVAALPDGDEARAYPDGAPHYTDGALIQLLPHVYDDAANGNGRARLTILHECGHVLLHRHVAVHHRAPRGADLKTYENSEWQASQFAVELLMPATTFDSPGDLETYVHRMGVSREAACNRALQIVRTMNKQPPSWPIAVYASSSRKPRGDTALFSHAATTLR
jgi:Zn-dependent peptidase ImmA (M78 family)